MSGSEYLTMFGMVSGVPPTKEKDTLTPVLGTWGNVAERDAYYSEHNIDVNGYQHSVPGDYLGNFTGTDPAMFAPGSEAIN